MKTNHFFAHYRTLLVVTACLFAASSTQAQTFMGQNQLTATPSGLEATMYPVAGRPATIRLNYNNPTAGGVWVIIRDEKGQKVYSEYEKVTQYRRRFDLSAMPAGTYTVQLKKQNDLIAQSFTIDPPTVGHITMGSQPVRKTPELPVDKKLIVSY